MLICAVSPLAKLLVFSAADVRMEHGTEPNHGRAELPAGFSHCFTLLQSGRHTKLDLNRTVTTHEVIRSVSPSNTNGAPAGLVACYITLVTSRLRLDTFVGDTVCRRV